MAQADIWASLLLAYSTPPNTCSLQLDWFPGPCLPGEWGLLLLFSQPPSPQTGFLICKLAWAIERGPIIQRGLERERERRGAGEERKERVKGEGEIQAPEIPMKDSTDWGGGWGQRNIITKNSSHVLQAEHFRRLIIAPLQI